MSTFDIGNRPFPALIHVVSNGEMRRYAPEPVDRDALLSLADEIEENACAAYHERWAETIRKAVGA